MLGFVSCHCTFFFLCGVRMYEDEATDNLENKRQWEFLRTWWPKEERDPNIEPLSVTRLQCQFDMFLDHPFPEIEWSSFEITLDQDAVDWPDVLVSLPSNQTFPVSQSFLLFPSFNWR
jgi:hypothetical protein